MLGVRVAEFAPMRRPLLLLSCIVLPWLAGCEGRVSVDLAVGRPADAAILQVVTGVAGVGFVTSDGATVDIEFTEPEAVNLMAFASGDVLSLLTDEPLPTGTYTGVRLLFDADAVPAYVTDRLARRWTLAQTQGDYAGLSLVVEEEATERAALTLTLDLRQSLRFDADAAEYVLAPYVRSVPADAASVLEGTVSVSCALGSSLALGGAVYAFEGQVVPDDRDGTGVEPYATAGLTFNVSTGRFSYRLFDLPAGTYTLAATCNGTLEDPATDDAITFRGTRSVTLAADRVLTANLSN